MEPNATFSIEMSTRRPSWPDTTARLETVIRDNVSGELLARYELTADQVILLQQGGHQAVRGATSAVTPRREHYGKELEVASVHLGHASEILRETYNRDELMAEAERRAEQLRADGSWEEVSVRLSNNGYHATLRRWNTAPDTDSNTLENETKEEQP